MKEEMLRFVARKPECFAVPGQLNMVRQRCEDCRYSNPCGAVITQVVGAIRSGSIPSATILKVKLISLERELEYWDCPEKYKSPIYELALLESLAQRAMAFRARPEEQTEKVTTSRNTRAPSAADAKFDRELEEILSGIDDRPDNPRNVEYAPILKEAASTDVGDTADHAAKVSTSLAVTGAPCFAVISAVAARDQTLAAVLPTRVAPMVVPGKLVATATYKFPMHEDRPYKSHSNDELIRELERLLTAGFYATPPLGYNAVRKGICAIHIEANLRQKHAPRFRPWQRLAKMATTSEEENAARDRQVIDIHWRAISKDKPDAPVNNYPNIFSNNPFDLAAAEQFAQERWSAPAKAAHLHLTEQMQWENSVIQNLKIQKAWFVIHRGDMHGDVVKQAGAPQIETKLREAVRRSGHLQIERSIPGMVDAWKARLIAGSSVSATTRMIALMTGSDPRDRRAVSRTLASVDSLLKPPCKPMKKTGIHPRTSSMT